jgi:hypothetical protein
LYNKEEWSSQCLEPLRLLEEPMRASVQLPLPVLQPVLPLQWASLPALPLAQGRTKEESIP